LGKPHLSESLGHLLLLLLLHLLHLLQHLLLLLLQQRGDPGGDSAKIVRSHYSHRAVRNIFSDKKTRVLYCSRTEHR
jgi:hypothetical protein